MQLTRMYGKLPKCLLGPWPIQSISCYVRGNVYFTTLYLGCLGILFHSACITSSSLRCGISLVEWPANPVPVPGWGRIRKIIREPPDVGEEAQREKQAGQFRYF